MPRTGSLRRVLTELEDDARRHLARPKGRVSRADGERLKFLFTIDTEISLGGCRGRPDLAPVGPDRRIWGETKDGAFGISCFADLFAELGVRGVFFFETMGKHVCGEEPLAAAARYLAERGHAVELHIHPEFKAHAETKVGDLEENIFRYSTETQRALIREGLDDIERWTGRRPIAFRAGAFGACPGVLEVAAQEGIRFDSSYNLWAIGQGPSGFDAALGLNDATPLGNLLEVPVTNLAVRLSRTGLKPFELSSLSTMEMAAAAEHLWASGHRVCCSLTHSFRLVRTRERQYRQARADGMNIHRLRALARYLRARPDRFEVVTFDDLPAEQWMAEHRRRESRPLPAPPVWASATRLAVQAFKDWGVV